MLDEVALIFEKLNEFGLVCELSEEFSVSERVCGDERLIVENEILGVSEVVRLEVLQHYNAFFRCRSLLIHRLLEVFVVAVRNLTSCMDQVEEFLLRFHVYMEVHLAV